MSSGDPSLWTSEEVAQFFRHCVPQFLANNSIHGLKLPNTDVLAEQLHQNDLDGRDLLEDIDQYALENVLGITVFKQRLAVLRIIRALRNASSAYVSDSTPLHVSLPSLPTPYASLPQTPIAPSTDLRHSDTRHIGTNTRPNEVLLEDSTGRKRRKLNLTAVRSSSSDDTQPVLSTTTLQIDQPVAVATTSGTISLKQKGSQGYLPDKKLSVDDIFYGGTRFGEEIRSASEDDMGFENFSIINQPDLAGQAAFIYSRVRRLLRNADICDITYHRRPAVAMYPYPESLVANKDIRSVTVFQADEVARVKALRERDATLSYQHDEVVDVQGDLGSEWNFLLQKYKGSENDKVIMAPLSDDTESEQSPTEKQTGSDSGSDDEMAEEESAVEENMLDKNLVPAVIERVVARQSRLWHDTKEPNLDSTKAWKVWRMTKGKNPLVKGFTQQARKFITQLDSRLERLEDNLKQRTWDNEADLEQACEILEPTVHDRLLQEWHILTWQRKEEPPHATHKPPDKGCRNVVVELRSQTKAEDDDDMQDFVEDDTFKDAREEITLDVESEHGSVQNSHFIQPVQDDEMAELPDGFEDDALTADRDEEMAEMPNEFEDALASVPVAEMAELPDAFNHTDEDTHRIRVPLEAGSPDLPSPSTFRPRSSQPSLQKTQVREVIEISSSPAKPIESPSKSKFSQKPIKLELKSSDDPDMEPITAIQRWTYEDIEEVQDRRRLMLKMALDLPTQNRETLLRFLTGTMTSCIRNTKEAIESLRRGREEHLEDGMRCAARLWNCWIHMNHTLFNANADKFSALHSELPFETEDDLTDDLRNWHANIKKAIQKVQNYSNSEASKKYIVLDDDDDDDFDEDQSSTLTAHRRRKREIKESQLALEKRARAMVRAEKAESQRSNPIVPAQTVDEDEIAIYAPKDVDESQHIFLNPEIAKRLKQHQVDGIEFMWREITAPKDEDGQGCLLAHTMGLGKTAQSIALVVTIAETAHSEEKSKVLPKDLRKKKLRVLVLSPPTLLPNWRNEINLWVPRSLRAGGKFGQTYSVDSTNAAKISRLDDLKNWRKYGGIMLCGYGMFSRLVDGKSGSKSDPFTEKEHKLVREILLDKPHIVIADEAHAIKNATTGASRAAHSIKTERRIGLTGSPMSNNTQEIYALINWVAPGFLGAANEFNANYAEPIILGTYLESSKWEVRRSLQKTAALKQIIAPKMNRADISVLKGSIRSKVEFVLTVPLTEEQRIPYEKYVEIVLKGKCGEEGTVVTQVRLFGWLAILQLLCNHPETFKKKLTEPKDSKSIKSKRASLPSSAEPSGSAHTSTAVPPSTAQPSTTDPFGLVGSPPAEEDATTYGDEHVLSYDIQEADVKQLLSFLPPSADVEFSYKTLLVRQILNLSIAAGDKVLLFSHSIPSLNFLETMLAGLKIRYGRIDGKVDQKNRSKVLDQMKDGKLDALLISTRAGGLGLNIQQANRVIIFDFGFNPQWEEQAVGRAYRLGQTKPVFVYRFVAGGTFEWQLYDKQIFKTGLSSRVVDKKNPIRNAAKKPSEWLYSPLPVAQGDIYSEAGKDEHVLDKIIAAHADGQDSYVRNIKTMETLMEDAKDEALTDEEMLAVQNDIAMATMVRKKAATGFEGRPTLAPPPPLSFGRPAHPSTQHGFAGPSSAGAHASGPVLGQLSTQSGQTMVP